MTGGSGAAGLEGACGAPEAKAEAPGRRSSLLRMPAGYTQGRGQGRAAARSPKEGREGSEGCQPEGEPRGRRQPGGCSGRGVRSAAPEGERNLRSGGAGPRPEDGGRGGQRGGKATAGGGGGRGLRRAAPVGLREFSTKARSARAAKVQPASAHPGPT